MTHSRFAFQSHNTHSASLIWYHTYGNAYRNHYQSVISSWPNFTKAQVRSTQGLALTRPIDFTLSSLPPSQWAGWKNAVFLWMKLRQWMVFLRVSRLAGRGRIAPHHRNWRQRGIIEGTARSPPEPSVILKRSRGRPTEHSGATKGLRFARRRSQIIIIFTIRTYFLLHSYWRNRTCTDLRDTANRAQIWACTQIGLRLDGPLKNRLSAIIYCFCKFPFCIFICIFAITCEWSY